MSEKEENVTAFSSATPAAATNRAAVIAAGAGIGRRKEAVARVRLTQELVAGLLIIRI